MSKVKSFLQSQTIQVSKNIRVVELDNDLYAFENVMEIHPENNFLTNIKNLNTSTNNNGFINKKNLNLLLKGKPYKTLDELVVLTNDQLRDVQRDCMLSVLEDDDFEISPVEQFEKNPDLTIDNVVNIDWDSGMLFDRHGKVLPTALVFDYISSSIDESRFDLDKLSDILLKRNDITIYKDDSSQKITKKSDAIYNIPYYNSEQGKEKSIQFIWHPNQKDMEAVWNFAQNFNKKYPSTELHSAFYALDIAGLKDAMKDETKNQYEEYQLNQKNSLKNKKSKRKMK